MEEGLAILRQLLETRCQEERRYQELLEQHPWMLGQYKAVQRHVAFDDKNIPDFVATRIANDLLDIIEIKHPFLDLFRQDGEPGSAFNDAWNQAENYLLFAERRRDYLQEDKGLRFENPACLLLIGSGLTEAQLRRLREKEGHRGGRVRLLTYDELLRTAEHVLSALRTAGEPLPAATITTTQPAPPASVS
jgi:hypothetical protein